jgi:RNA polymerase sigma-70 factor (ECF subfamily)
MSNSVNVAALQSVSCAVPRTLDDKTLIRQAQRGSSQAFEQLVRRYDQAVLRLAVRLTGSEHDAQDIYQEAFLKAFKNIANFRSESTFYTWIHRIVCNLCMDSLRMKKSRREDSAIVWDRDGNLLDVIDRAADLHPASDPERQALQLELRRHIRLALGKLTPRERVVFELKHFQGLKLRIVGELLNTSEETAKNTLFRATHKLRKCLAHLRQPA